MSRIKRSASDTPPAQAVITPKVEEHEPTSSPPKKAKSTDKSGSTPGKRGSGAATAKTQQRVRVPWTAEEEVIFAQIASDVLREHMWAKVKEDGRLKHRGSDGIRVHATTVLNKAKKLPAGQADK